MEGPEWPRCRGARLWLVSIYTPATWHGPCCEHGATWPFSSFRQPLVWFTLCQNPWNFLICTGRIGDPFTTQTVDPVWSEHSAAVWLKKRSGRSFTACFLLQRDTDGLTEIWKDLQMQLLLQWASWSMGRSAGGAELRWWHLHYEVAQIRGAYIVSPDKL